MKRTNSKAWNRGQERARYVRIFEGHWPGVTEWVEAEVSTWDDGWEARCSTGFPNKVRDQWNVWKTFPTRDEAANFAAAFVVKSEELVAAVLVGAPLVHPNAPMREALARELSRLPRVAAAREKLDAAMTNREIQAAREYLRRIEAEAELAWWRSHDWRDFVAVDSKPLASKPEEEDHEHRSSSAA